MNPLRVTSNSMCNQLDYTNQYSLIRDCYSSYYICCMKALVAFFICLTHHWDYLNCLLFIIHVRMCCIVHGPYDNFLKDCLWMHCETSLFVVAIVASSCGAVIGIISILKVNLNVGIAVSRLMGSLHGTLLMDQSSNCLISVRYWELVMLLRLYSSVSAVYY